MAYTVMLSQIIGYMRHWSVTIATRKLLVVVL